jgi:hypothetical protein
MDHTLSAVLINLPAHKHVVAQRSRAVNELPTPWLVALLLPELLAAAVEREHASIGVRGLERAVGRTHDDLAAD